jgi:hypothetical protein
MQVPCPKYKLIVIIGKADWFFDGGECSELRGTVAANAQNLKSAGPHRSGV